LNIERDFKGIWIPKDIWINGKLSIMEKIFLIEIDSLDNDHGCFASNSYFSEFFSLNKSRCSQIINSLVDKKLLTVEMEKKGGQIIKRTLRLIYKLKDINEDLVKSDKTKEHGVVNKLKGVVSSSIKPDKTKEHGVVNKLKGVVSKCEEGYLENAKDNNTNINNTNNMLPELIISYKNVKITEEQIEIQSQENNINPTSLFCSVEELKDSNLYNNSEKLLKNAIQITKRQSGSDDVVETKIPNLKISKIVSRERDCCLSATQHLYISSFLNYTATKVNFEKTEIYSWIEFQLENYNSHFVGKDFLHVCNAIQNILLKSGKDGFCKPKGFDKWNRSKQRNAA
jgi:hypothetical protein